MVRNENYKNSFHSFAFMITKERIQEKAEELFIKYGIKRITMDEIAAQLGISKKTIYLSFADKNELVSEIFDKHILQSKDDCTTDAEKAENAVHELLLGSETFCKTMESINPSILYDLEKYHPDVFRRFIEFKNNFLHSLIKQNLKRGIAEELYRSDINVEIITRLRLTEILLPTNIELFPTRQFKLSDVEWEIITHFLYGIVTQKGAKMIKKYMHQPAKAIHAFS